MKHDTLQLVVRRGCVIVAWALLISGRAISHDVAQESDIRSSRIHGSDSSLTVSIHRDSTNESSIYLSLSGTNSLEPVQDLVVLRIPNPSRECFDFWVSSTQKPLTCLVLVKRQLGTIVQHSIFPYRVAKNKLEAVPYRSHVRTLSRQVGSHVEEITRPMPLNVESSLRGKLDPKSPVNDPNLTSIVVRTVESVQMADSADGPVVQGILNDDWHFLLSLEVDEGSETLKLGNLALDPSRE